MADAVRPSMRWAVVAAMILCLAAQVWAADDTQRFLEDFVVGHYQLVGRTPDGGGAYHGRVEISRTTGGLQVRRHVHGTEQTGTAAVEQATADRVPVLRIRFRGTAGDYEETCMVGSDLDNRARITCYLYRPGSHTRQPGLEALFADPAARGR